MTTQWILYLLQVSIWWLLTWLITRLWLARYGQPAQWRILVLTGLIAGMLVPLIPWSSSLPEEVSIILPEIRIGVEAPFVDKRPEGSTNFPWTALWITLYLAGLTWRSTQWIRAMKGLYGLYLRSAKRFHQDEVIRVVPDLDIPFQFAGQIFIPERLLDQSAALEMAVAHERAHKRYHHTWDLMIAQCISMAFWFHPLPRLLVKQLQLIHEFQADSAVLSKVEADPYARFIGQYRFSFSAVQPIHALNHGPLKTRIMKIYRPSANLSWNHRLFLLITVCALVTLSATMHTDSSVIRKDSIPGNRIKTALPSQLQDQGLMRGTDAAIVRPSMDNFTSAIPSIPEPPSPPTSPQPLEQPSPPAAPHHGQSPDQMPRFPGCEEIADPTEREQCATRKFLQYVYTHLRYPAAAREQALAGTCIASFFVETDGRIREVNLLKDIGGGTDEAIKDIFRMMETEGILWIPATKDGKPVRGEMTLPIRFALSEE